MPAVLRLSLDRILTLDLTPFLPAETLVDYAYLSFDSEIEYNSPFETNFDRDTGMLTLYPRSMGDMELALRDPANPDTPVARIVVLTYPSMEEPLYLDVLGAVPLSDTEATQRGTAGADTMLLDTTADPEAGTALIDTSGGSDLAVVLGTAAAVMLGRSGNDTLVGADGNDGLYGGGGEDRLLGMGGADRLLGMGGADRLFGGAGHDMLFGGAGNDILEGGDGDDILVADAGNDTLRGGAGADQMIASENSRFESRVSLEGGGLVMVAFGGEGDDTISGAFGASTLHGGAGDDYLSGNVLLGADIQGGAGNDNIYAGVANEDNIAMLGPDAGTVLVASTIQGGDGGDYISIYGGASRIFGGAGNDVLYGQGTLSGGDGDDTMANTGSLATILFGGMGNDTLMVWGGGDNATEMHGGDGTDSITGGQEGDLLYGGIGNDILSGGSEDTIVGGADTLYGGSGDDTLYGSQGVMSAMGGLANDEMYGGGGDDMIWSYRGGDSLYGGDGADNIIVQNAYPWEDDTAIDGGRGDDRITATGDSVATGGLGDDVFVLNTTNAWLTHTMRVSDFTRGEDRLDVTFDGGNMNSLAISLDGNGTSDFLGGGARSLAWIQQGTDAVVLIDSDGDGDVEGMFILDDTVGLTFNDLAVLL